MWLEPSLESNGIQKRIDKESRNVTPINLQKLLLNSYICSCVLFLSFSLAFFRPFFPAFPFLFLFSFPFCLSKAREKEKKRKGREKIRKIQYFGTIKRFPTEYIKSRESGAVCTERGMYRSKRETHLYKQDVDPTHED